MWIRAELLKRVQRRVQSVQMRCFVRTRARARGVACADRCKRWALPSPLFSSPFLSSPLDVSYLCVSNFSSTAHQPPPLSTSSPLSLCLSPFLFSSLSWYFYLHTVISSLSKIKKTHSLSYFYLFKIYKVSVYCNILYALCVKPNKTKETNRNIWWNWKW